MAVAPVTFADLGNNGGSTNNLTTAFTVGASSTKLVVGFIGDFIVGGGGGGNDDVTSVTYNSVAMTLVKKLVDNSSNNAPRYSYLYELASPATGAHNIVISCTNNHYILGLAVDFSGAGTQASDATGQALDDSGGLTTITGSITTVVDASWVLALQSGAGNATDDAITSNLETLGAAFGQPGLFSWTSDGVTSAVVSPAATKSLTCDSTGSVPGLNLILMTVPPPTTSTFTYFGMTQPEIGHIARPPVMVAY